MKWVLVIVILVAMATGQAARNTSKWLKYEEEWNRYKTKFAKVYTTPEEETRRGKVFRENLEYIAKHNREADRGLHSYRLGVTPFADMTQEEFAQSRAGIAQIFNSQNSSLNDLETHIPRGGSLSDVDYMDWREYNAITSVRNQGDCNSCYAITAAEAIEAYYKLSGHPLTQLSAQQLVDCSWNCGNRGCTGGTVRGCFRYLTKTSLMTEEDYPYTGPGKEKCKYEKVTPVRVSKVFKITKGSEDHLKNAVATVGPVAACIHGSETDFYLYKEGIYENCPTDHNGRYLDHALLVIGFRNKGDGKDYWIVKNSWGTGWGENGFGKIAMYRKGMCGIADRATYATVDGHVP